TTKKNTTDLIESLKLAGYGVTALDAHGATGPVRVVFTVVKRKELDNVVARIKGFDSKAFYAVNDLQLAAEGVFPSAGRRRRNILRVPTLPLQLNWHSSSRLVRLSS